MSIAKHTIYNIGGTVVPIAVSLISVPLYLSAIGLERYGVLSLCLAMLGYMGFLNLGLGPAVSQKLARLRDSPLEREGIFWTAFWMNIGMGLVGGMAVWLLAGLYFDTLTGVPPAMHVEMDRALPWLAAIIPVGMLSGVLTGALQGRERFLAVNIISAASLTLMSLLPLMVAYVFGPRLDWLIAAALLARGISLGLLYVVCAKAVPLRLPQAPRFANAKPLLAFGGWITLATLIAPFIATIDRFVIGSLIGVAAVSIYIVPYSLVSRITILPQSLTSALFPRFAYTTYDESDRLEMDAVRALATAITPVAVFGIAAVGPFLTLWIGEVLAAQSAPIAYILVAGFWCNSFARIPYALLQASGRPDLVAKLLALYLIPYAVVLYACLTLFGVIGAAVAWTIKAAFDPITFFLLRGKLKRVLPVLIVPGLWVFGAMTVALALPPDSALRWGLLALDLIVAGLWALWTAPPLVADRLARFLPRRSVREK